MKTKTKDRAIYFTDIEKPQKPSFFKFFLLSSLAMCVMMGIYYSITGLSESIVYAGIGLTWLAFLVIAIVGGFVK